MTKSLGKRVSRETASMRLLAVLEACAIEGRPCPANGELGELLGYDQSYPSKLVKHLELKGLIRVARGSRVRIVTILADGPAKGCTTDGDHVRIREYHQVQRTIVRRAILAPAAACAAMWAADTARFWNRGGSDELERPDPAAARGRAARTARRPQGQLDAAAAGGAASLGGGADAGGLSRRHDWGKRFVCGVR